MASLYQASQEQTILAAGDDDLPISGLTKSDLKTGTYEALGSNKDRDASEGWR